MKPTLAAVMVVLVFLITGCMLSAATLQQGFGGIYRNSGIDPIADFGYYNYTDSVGEHRFSNINIKATNPDDPLFIGFHFDWGPKTRFGLTYDEKDNSFKISTPFFYYSNQ